MPYIPEQRRIILYLPLFSVNAESEPEVEEAHASTPILALSLLYKKATSLGEQCNCPLVHCVPSNHVFFLLTEGGLPKAAPGL